MLSKIITASLKGMDVEKVTVETDLSQGIPSLSLVGLPDMMVKESKERIRSAIVNSGYSFPLKRITVNLSPADKRKTGSHFDLPMAIGILTSVGLIPVSKLDNTAFLGELSLDGSVNPIESCLALALGLKEQGIKTLYLPKANINELSQLEDVTIYLIETFTELVDHLTDLTKIDEMKFADNSDSLKAGLDKNSIDYSDVFGQDIGKRAMQISAAGWHNLIMVGPPGAGKTMLAKRIKTIISEPSKKELIEIAKIHNIAGEQILGPNEAERPFRAPHHTATSVSLTGGGYNSKPGELSLAHRGVLFLDEIAEFDRRVLDMLRQPLEDGYINLSRLAARHRYPCEFILIAAMNPCGCGYYGDHTHECICNTAQRVRYNQKVSGPFKDRLDIQITINAVDFKETKKRRTKPISSSDLKEGVLRATEIQRKRYDGMNYKYNSRIPDNKLDFYCNLSESSNELLVNICETWNVSARAIGKIKRVARTIADIDGSETITESHIAEAASYRLSSDEDRVN